MLIEKIRETSLMITVALSTSRKIAYVHTLRRDLQPIQIK